MRTLRVVEPMLPAERIEVRACGGERGRFGSVTFAHSVKVNRVGARRHGDQLRIDVHDVVGVLPQLSSAPLIARGVPDSRIRNRDAV
jgi:hypothetical protein